MKSTDVLEDSPLGVEGLLSVAGVNFEPSQQTLERARAFAEPFLSTQQLDNGENCLAHADALAVLVKSLGASDDMQAASYLAFACEHLNKPQDLIEKAFGASHAALAMETMRLMQLQRQAQTRAAKDVQGQVQIEFVRRMLLAFSRDLRVVVLRLASRLQTLRYLHAHKKTDFDDVAKESLLVFAPLANRLGIWQIKWEMEDLAFRLLEPQTYKQVAAWLEDKRVEREAQVTQLRQSLADQLLAQGIAAEVQGRPKHIYSIIKKMRGKSLDFSQVLDLRALRVIVGTVEDCYRVLSWVHAQMTPLENEFDDYIAKPKSNGYQSLHTVVSDTSGRVVEIQIRTHAMHAHAEFGVAAHWAYKEAGAKGYSGVQVSDVQAKKMAVLRQLLAWERDLNQAAHADPKVSLVDEDDKIYVLTPQAAIVELPVHATPVDFAYSLHTDLGHRCRGAKVDGLMVPLSTPLRNGQTVEVIVAKEGGPSRDWLNPELGFLSSHRAKAKVRAWFNAQVANQTMAKGRELVERLLQREGKTALKLDELAVQLGFPAAAQLFEVVGKDEFSLKTIETFLRPPAPLLDDDERLLRKTQRSKSQSTPSGVLVVGVDSLMTQLAKCCRPAPPDTLGGFVTRGKGVSVHRSSCKNFVQLSMTAPDRVIPVAWSANNRTDALYPVDIQIVANDRQGLLRDISEVFAKDKINVIGVQTQSIKETAWMTFTVEVGDASKLNKVLTVVKDVSGVRTARRHLG
jgi:GTP pyrophosphokinase